MAVVIAIGPQALSSPSRDETIRMRWPSLLREAPPERSERATNGGQCSKEGTSIDRVLGRLGGTLQLLRIAALALFALLAWEALDPRIDASNSQVLRVLQLIGYLSRRR
jgi:hypothetical protein